MKSPPLSEDQIAKLAELDGLLDRAYGAPEADLGNQQDPLDEAVYIILSSQTNLSRFRSVWDRLKSKFPRWDNLERLPEEELAAVLREGGLQHQKTHNVRNLLSEIRRKEGCLSLDCLRGLSDGDAENYLLGLPGISWKTARCVLLYSLNRKVFPVDVNVFRILKRVGVLPRDAVYRRRSLHDALQQAVPSEHRRAFHVNLVVHGQRICTPLVPKCLTCPVRSICSMVGVLEAIRRMGMREESLAAADMEERAPSSVSGSAVVRAVDQASTKG